MRDDSCDCHDVAAAVTGLCALCDTKTLGCESDGTYPVSDPSFDVMCCTPGAKLAYDTIVKDKYATATGGGDIGLDRSGILTC